MSNEDGSRNGPENGAGANEPDIDDNYKGRVRTSHNDLKSKAARTLFLEFIDWEKTAFMPWHEPGSVQHWKSNDLYQDVSYGNFKCQAQKLALLALSQIPDPELPAHARDIKKQNSHRG